MDVVRFGIIGVGGRGTSQCRLMPQVKEAKLTAVADTNPKAARAAAEQFGVPGFGSGSELIHSGLVDAVMIATPHYFHPPLAIEAMRAGLHVLVEKPLAVHTSAADEMIRVAEETGLVFSVMFQQRTRPEIQAAHKIIQEGRLGEIYRTLLIEGRFRSQAYYDTADWRATWEGEGGGVLANQAPHLLDLFVWLGGQPSRVIGRMQTRQHDIETEDEASAMLEYPNGAAGYLYTSVNELPQSNRIELCGEYGKLVITGGGEVEFWEVPAGVKAFSRGAETRKSTTEVNKVDVEIVPADAGHAALTRNTARAILYGEPLVAPGPEGIRCLELVNAIMLSADKGSAPVDIPVDRAAFDAFIERKKAESRRARA